MQAAIAAVAIKQRIEGGSVYERFCPITRGRQVLNKFIRLSVLHFEVLEACNALIASAVNRF